MNIVKKATLATALAASALVSATPASARDYYGRHNGGDKTAAVIAGGIVGIALGAIIASSGRDHDRYRDRYYRSNRHYDRDGRYYDRDGRYYDGDGRYHRDFDREGYERRGYRGY